MASAQELLKDSELTDENVRYALLRMEDKDGGSFWSGARARNATGGR